MEIWPRVIFRLLNVTIKLKAVQKQWEKQVKTEITLHYVMLFRRLQFRSGTHSQNFDHSQSALSVLAQHVLLI